MKHILRVLGLVWQNFQNLLMLNDFFLDGALEEELSESSSLFLAHIWEALLYVLEN